METAFLLIPGGRSPSSQPHRPGTRVVAMTRASKDRRRRPRPAVGVWYPEKPAVDSIIIGDNFPPCASAQGLIGAIIHLVPQVAYVTVAVEEVRAAAVAAEELVD